MPTSWFSSQKFCSKSFLDWKQQNLTLVAVLSEAGMSSCASIRWDNRGCPDMRYYKFFPYFPFKMEFRQKAVGILGTNGWNFREFFLSFCCLIFRMPEREWHVSLSCPSMRHGKASSMITGPRLNANWGGEMSHGEIRMLFLETLGINAGQRKEQVTTPAGRLRNMHCNRNPPLPLRDSLAKDWRLSPENCWSSGAERPQTWYKADAICHLRKAENVIGA